VRGDEPTGGLPTHPFLLDGTVERESVDTKLRVVLQVPTGHAGRDLLSQPLDLDRGGRSDVMGDGCAETGKCAVGRYCGFLVLCRSSGGSVPSMRGAYLIVVLYRGELML